MDASSPRVADLLAVRGRVSWPAVAAGAMIATAIYFVLTLLGVALGLEVIARGASTHLGAGTAIYAILTLLLAMFFGGWATSRLAVGESKLEAVLHGVILWGTLFLGLVWLFGAGIRTGFGAMVTLSTGAFSPSPASSGRLDIDPSNPPRVSLDVANRPDIQPAEGQVAEGARQATWWTLLGVITSMATVVVGSLVGSGELLQPIPILGVRRAVALPSRV